MLAKALVVGKAGVSTTLNAVRERSAVKVARSVLRGPRFREETRLPSRTGPSGYQTPDPADAGIQELPPCEGHSRRHRGNAHDQERTDEMCGQRPVVCFPAVLLPFIISNTYPIDISRPDTRTATEPSFYPTRGRRASGPLEQSHSAVGLRCNISGIVLCETIFGHLRQPVRSMGCVYMTIRRACKLH